MGNDMASRLRTRVADQPEPKGAGTTLAPQPELCLTSPLYFESRPGLSTTIGKSQDSRLGEEHRLPTADYNANLLLYPTLEDKVWGSEDILRLEDQAGIERAIIVPACQVWPDNEGLAKAIRGYDRLTGCAIINPQFGEKAVQELERCVQEWGIKGLKLMPTFHGYPVHTAVVDPLIQKVRELGILLTVHSGSWNAEPLQISVLADRYPEVPIIMEHSGFRWYFPDALAAARRSPNIYLGLSILATETVMVLDIFKAVGPERMVFGSDVPAAYPDLAAEAIRRCKFGKDANDLIFGGVLSKIYRFDN